jgi:ribosomal protein L34
MSRAVVHQRWGATGTRWLVGFAAAGLCTFALAGSAAAARTGSSQPAVQIGRLTPISTSTPFPAGCPPDSARPGAQGAEYEPTLAADPGDSAHLVAAWIQDGGLSLVSAFSRDSGRHWTRALVPGVSHCTGGNTAGAVNPWLSFGPDRTLYIVGLGADVDSAYPFTNARSQVTGNRLQGPATSWSSAAVVQPYDGSYYDKPTVTADPRVPGRAYAVWGKRSGPTGDSGITLFSTTADGGKTWSAPVTIYDPGSTPYPQWSHGDTINVLPDGTLLDVFGLMNNSPFFSSSTPLPDAVMAMRSSDGGKTWSKATKIADVPSRMASDDDTGNPQTRVITLPIPSAAVDGHGRVFVTWHENPDPTGGRILMSSSTDDGRSWSAPVTIDAPRAQAFLPAISVSPTGTVGVIFYDTRHDVSGSGKLTTDLWFAHSHDLGKTWQQTHVAGPFDALTAINFYSLGHLIGDSIDLAPAPDGFNAVFSLAQPLAIGGPTTVFYDRITLAGHSQPALHLLVRPRAVHANHRVKLSFRVTAPDAGTTRPVEGALIRFIGHRLRTSTKGRTTIIYRFRRRGRYKLTVAKAGYQRASATITVGA